MHAPRPGRGRGGRSTQTSSQTCDVLIFQNAATGSSDPFPGTGFSSRVVLFDGPGARPGLQRPKTAGKPAVLMSVVRRD
eukprot:8046483-Pyramimonas_sp.AAC.1